MEEFINTFHIDWKLMVAQLFNFGIVFLAFYLLATKPLRKIMNKRGEEIETGLEDAKAGRELMQKAKEEYEENTIKLRKQSIETQKELTKEMEKIRAENLERIKKDEEEYQKKRIAQLEVDKKAIVESAKKDIITLAMAATEKLISSKKDLNNL